MENETNIKIIGDSIYGIALKKGILNGKILELQQELLKTPIWLEIQEKKQEVIEFEKKEKEAKDFILNSLQENGVKSIDFTNQKMTVKKSGGSINVTNEAEIPDNYFNEVTTKKLDKKALKEGLLLGDAVPGAEIKYSHTLLITSR